MTHPVILQSWFMVLMYFNVIHSSVSRAARLIEETVVFINIYIYIYLYLFIFFLFNFFQWFFNGFYWQPVRLSKKQPEIQLLRAEVNSRMSWKCHIATFSCRFANKPAQCLAFDRSTEPTQGAIK